MEMRMIRRRMICSLALAVGLLAAAATASGQEPAILSGADLEKVVPANFYFEGQLGPTQMRNGAAVRFADRHNLVAALVDTSGYASNIRSKYEGFLITDKPVKIGGTELPAGAYGFGFPDDTKMNIFDVGGKQIHSVSATRDENLQSPRPLAFVKSGNSIRLYKGRTYVTVSTK
jgi:hypothetical protein